ncbi:MAG: uracil-DNA glycosylase [Alphaproteobacteria bacterium]|nr:uracil-DNA glycosylase [Alphaproteobacteria bacterium]MCL2757728.1 uracil-DNA glycosylase [Alphaproteobacteria bacterium]
MNVKIEESWKNALGGEFDKPYFIQLTDFVRDAYNKWATGGPAIYPKPAEIFNAFNLCPLDKVKVVIIGQDPYHGPGQAHGLCFSVRDGTQFPPSLQNIYKEIASDLGRPSATRGDLTRWAEQGVLLLNSSLTVQAHVAASHSSKGWEQFTDACIRALSARDGIVYILWGSYAQKKAEFVDPLRNLVLKSVHPSPLSASRGFFGNKHFSRTNEYLANKGAEPIEW